MSAPSLSVGVMLLAVSMSAQAPPLGAQERDGRFYLGAGLDLSDYASASDAIGYDDTPLGASFYGGARLRDRVAIEAALATYSSIDSGIVLGSGVERLRIASDLDAFVLRGVFSFDLRDLTARAERWTLFATAGGFASRESRRVLELNAGATTESTLDDTGTAFGFGALYRLSHITIRGAFEQRNGGDADATTIGVAAELHF